MPENRYILMIGPSYTAFGGMASVIDVYRTQGLFDEWPVLFVPTHKEAGKLTKLTVALNAALICLKNLLLSRVSLMHVHVAQRTSFYRKALFVMLAWVFRCPYVLHLHGCEFKEFYEECSPSWRAIVRWVFRHAANVIALSSSWRAWVLSVEPAARAVVIHNPVAIPAVPARPEESADGCKVLFMGRLGHRKGIYDLLQAFAPIVRRHPDIQLLCGGDGEIDEVKARALSLGIDTNVQVLGWVSGADKFQLFASANIYVLPSYNEGLPMAILEAMAAGLPVVTTNVGGIPDAIDEGRDGFMVEAGDVRALEISLDRLIDDGALRGRIGRDARLKAQQHFDTKVIFRELGVIFERCGARRRSQ